MSASSRRIVSLTRRESAELLRALTDRGVRVTLEVRGSSMHPALRDGDVVTVAPPGPGPVPLGAVVAAESPEAGGLVVHRVVGRSAEGLLLRGDNAERPDGTVPGSAVIGVVVRVERGGRVVRALPDALRQPFAVLVRGGLVRGLNRARGRVGACVPSALRAFRERRRKASAGKDPLIASPTETESR